MVASAGAGGTCLHCTFSGAPHGAAAVSWTASTAAECPQPGGWWCLLHVANLTAAQLHRSVMLPCLLGAPSLKGWWPPAAHGKQCSILKTLISSWLVGAWVFAGPAAAQHGTTGRRHL